MNHIDLNLNFIINNKIYEKKIIILSNIKDNLKITIIIQILISKKKINLY